MNLLPTGTAVTILADTFGDKAVRGTVAGHTVYTHPVTLRANQLGYVIHLDQGFFHPGVTPIGAAPWIGTIVAHVESVEAIVADGTDDAWHCDECGQVCDTPTAVSYEHGGDCSLNPANVRTSRLIR
jgi:hypothetical protein